MRDRVAGGIAGQLTGIALPIPDDLPGNLAGVLEALVARRPEGKYVEIRQDGSRAEATFGDLLESAREILTRCRDLGFEPGSEIILCFDEFLEFVPALWASFLGNFWAIPWHISSSELAGVGLADRFAILGKTFRSPVVICPQRIADRISAEAAVSSPAVSCSVPAFGGSGSR